MGTLIPRTPPIVKAGRVPVSVVTPFYNTAAFLAECIESVLAQSYPNFEYVLVDNQSTDGSAEIAAHYAASDPRIRLVRNDVFLGQVDNYNRALSSISPESAYVKVVEADNWIESSCIEQMLSVAVSNPSVGLVSAYNVTERTVRLTKCDISEAVIDGRRAARMHLIEGAYLFAAPTTVMMRADLVRARNPFYPTDGAPAEDVRACYEILRSADFAFVHQVLTFVRLENDSILKRLRGFQGHHLDRYVVLQAVGRNFLSPAEHAAMLASVRRRYYAEISKALTSPRRREIFDFHRTGLNAIGIEFSRPRLVLGALEQALRAVLNPEVTLRSAAGASVRAIQARLDDARRAREDRRGSATAREHHQ